MVVEGLAHGPLGRRRIVGVIAGLVGGAALLGTFRSSSSWTKLASSRFENCRSLMACKSCGVITRDCPWRIISFVESAIRPDAAQRVN
jgi:hypothetical protein